MQDQTFCCPSFQRDAPMQLLLHIPQNGGALPSCPKPVQFTFNASKTHSKWRQDYRQQDNTLHCPELPSFSPLQQATEGAALPAQAGLEELAESQRSIIYSQQLFLEKNQNIKTQFKCHTAYKKRASCLSTPGKRNNRGSTSEINQY